MENDQRTFNACYEMMDMCQQLTAYRLSNRLAQVWGVRRSEAECQAFLDKYPVKRLREIQASQFSAK